MPDDLVLPLPDSVEAIYTVPTSRPPDDPSATALAFAFEHLDEPLRGVLLHAIAEGSCLVTTRPATDAPPLPVGLLRSFGADAALVDAAVDATSVVTIATAARPHERPQAEHVARAAALGIAKSVGAPVVDTFLPRLMTIDQLTDVVANNFATRIADLVLVLQSAGSTGTWMTTKGLGRFGLPELEARDVPPPLSRPMTNLMTGLAGVLVTRLVGSGSRGDGAFLTMDAIVMVDEHDVARAYGHVPEPTGEEPRAVPTTGVRLTLEPGSAQDHGGFSDTFLAVGPPPTYDRCAGEFYAAICDELFGVHEGEVVLASRSAEMDAAMAEARRALPEARRRFVADELPRGHQLLVKHRLTVGDRSEFPWLFVTSWTDDAVVLGTAANDAELDPSVRVGRPLVVDADTVVDWGIWVDGQGMIEGGWTNEVLGR